MTAMSSIFMLPRRTGFEPVAFGRFVSMSSCVCADALPEIGPLSAGCDLENGEPGPLLPCFPDTAASMGIAVGVPLETLGIALIQQGQHDCRVLRATFAGLADAVSMSRHR